jgi:hypothetical protein
MTTTISGTTGITYPDGTTQSGVSIPSGSITNFANAAAPTGWTQITTYNNYAMRIVSGTGAGTGGTVDFTTAFASGSTGSYTLATADIPSHTHTYGQVFSTAQSQAGGGPDTNKTTSNTGATGGGGGHSHSLSLAVKYVDNILCLKS